MKSALPFLALLVLSPVLTAQEKKDKTDLRALIGRLDPRKEDICLYVLEELEVIKTDLTPALPALLPLLEVENEEIRIRAALVLGKIGKAAAPGLLERLNHKNAEVRYYAVWALGLVGPGAAPAEKLLPLLEDKTASVRRKAAFALGRIKTGGKKTALALAECLHDPDLDVGRAAGDALVAFGPAAVERVHLALGSKRAAVKGLALNVLSQLAQEHPETVPFLVDALHLPQWPLREGAAQGLSTIKHFDPHTVLALARGLKDPQYEVRLACAQALRRAGESAGPAAFALEKALFLPELSVSKIAWHTLGALGHDARPLLRKWLKSAQAEDRLAAARIFLDVAEEPREPVAALIEILGMASLSHKVEAALMLARSGQGIEPLCAVLEWMIHLEDKRFAYKVYEAVKHLAARNAEGASLAVAYLGHPSPTYRADTLEALLSLKEQGRSAQAAVFERLEDSHLEVCYMALVVLEAQEADPKRCYPAFRRILLDKEYGGSLIYHLGFYPVSKTWAARMVVHGCRDKEEAVRRGCIQICHYSKLADKEVLSSLERLAREDALAEIRYAAIDALSRVPDHALPQLVACMGSKDTEVVNRASQAVAKAGKWEEPVVEALARLLKDESLHIRRSAAWVLAHSGRQGAKALPALRVAMKDEDPVVRDAASHAVRVIEGAIRASKSK